MRIIKYISREVDRQTIKVKQEIKFKEKNNVYRKRNSLLTVVEKNYYRFISNAIKDTEYIVLPQINLATIIEKISQGYNNELFRNIDFGIFDKSTLEPLCMIEINDTSHDKYNRMERDQKVKNILSMCNLPLLTLHTTCRYTNLQFMQMLSYKINKAKENTNKENNPED